MAWAVEWAVAWAVEWAWAAPCRALASENPLEVRDHCVNSMGNSLDFLRWNMDNLWIAMDNLWIIYGKFIEKV